MFGLWSGGGDFCGPLDIGDCSEVEVFDLLPVNEEEYSARNRAD